MRLFMADMGLEPVRMPRRHLVLRYASSLPTALPSFLFGGSFSSAVA